MDFYAELELARRNCKPKEQQFALSLASGLDEKHAYLQVFGQKNANKPYIIQKKTQALLRGPAGVYFGLLSHPINEQIIAPYALQRQERLQLLSMGAVLAYKSAASDPDVKALNPMVRCLNELNKMTGEHAPEQVEVRSSIMAACINSEITEEEATELYRQVMRGSRITLDSNDSQAQPQAVEYTPIVQHNENAEITE